MPANHKLDISPLGLIHLVSKMLVTPFAEFMEICESLQDQIL